MKFLFAQMQKMGVTLFTFLHQEIKKEKRNFYSFFTAIKQAWFIT